MKLLFAVVVAAFMATIVLADDKYTTKFDNIDVDEILKSDRLFNNYYKCLTDEGKCTPDGRELKKNLPDALQTECSKCSAKQKESSEKILNFIVENKPEEWKVLQAKYDPEGVYITKYREEAKKRGIKV
uniref:Chemosensory protein 1 n=1 Tax=Delia antiqua TaxID=265456 RepID=D4AHN9_9MUSC|nr:chemosensory protein 1 [Delia antiqua]